MAELVTENEVKEFMKVTGNDDNAAVHRAYEAAVEYAERYTGVSFSSGIVPQCVNQAICVLAADLYDTRNSEIKGTTMFCADNLLALYREEFGCGSTE